MPNASTVGQTLVPSSGRRPRGIVKVNGTAIQFISFEVTNKSHFTADTWRVDLEPWNQPEGFGIDFWPDANDAVVEILFGFLEDGQDVGAQVSPTKSFIKGQVDDVELDPLTGKLTISGRDFTAKLIDTRTTQKWPDQTASQIATTIATQNGLIPNVTATSTPAGSFYASSYVSVSRDIPEWDLLVFLAQQEGFDCYVTGSTLYFGPPQADNDPRPLLVVASKAQEQVYGSAISCILRRSLTLAKDISVVVISHSVATGKTVKATATRAGTKPTESPSSRGAEKVQNYTFRRPNMSQEQAQQFANQTLVDLTKFERTAEITVRGNPNINVQRKVVIKGTATSFDQDYYVQQVKHRLSFDGGYVTSMSVKNHSTVSQPAF